MIRFSLTIGNSLVKFLRVITLNVNGIQLQNTKAGQKEFYKEC
jgi:hypothetical protein